MPACNPLYLSLDLEMNQPSGHIIQIGACIGELSSGKLVADFSCFVNPEEALDLRISALCGIPPADLVNAPCLLDAYAQFLAWLKPYDDTRQLNPLTWGGDDSAYLLTRLGVATGEAPYPFGRRCVDVKTVFVALQNAKGLAGQGGLANAMKTLKLLFEGRKHNARDDAWNTFRMYVALLKSFNPNF
jgi:inhibitor of KinA sporulation pathway (predicted exonuclease)